MNMEFNNIKWINNSIPCLMCSKYSCRSSFYQYQMNTLKMNWTEKETFIWRSFTVIVLFQVRLVRCSYLHVCNSNVTLSFGNSTPTANKQSYMQSNIFFELNWKYFMEFYRRQIYIRQNEPSSWIPRTFPGTVLQLLISEHLTSVPKLKCTYEPGLPSPSIEHF